MFYYGWLLIPSVRRGKKKQKKVQQLVDIFLRVLSCFAHHPHLPLTHENIKAQPQWNFKPILASPSYLWIQ